jgi:hypothetical protein
VGSILCNAIGPWSEICFSSDSLRERLKSINTKTDQTGVSGITNMAASVDDR